MIQVMIVEDEPLIARSLETLIKKNNPHFHVCAIAENGREAIELFNKEKIDVIFTDIKMPIMTGFELLQYLKQEEKEVLTVILSGFRDFEYAREAIQYQVVDYLLKPLSVKNLTEILNHLQAEYEKRNHLQKQKTLRLNMESSVDSEIEKGNCQMGILCIGSYPIMLDDTLLPGASFEIQKKLEEIVESYNNSLVTAWIFHGMTSVEWNIIAEDNHTDRESNCILLSIYEDIKQNLLLPVTMMTHKEGIDINSIGRMKKLLRQHIYKRLIFGKSEFFYLEDPADNQEDGDFEEKIYEIRTSVKKENVQDKLENLLMLCEKNQVTQKKLLLYIQLFLTSYCEQERCEKILDNMSEIGSVSCGYHELMMEIKDLIKISESLNQKEEKQEAVNPLAEDVKKYLDQNYSSNITYMQLSKEFGFSSSYLNKLLKNRYGTTIVNYIIYKRVEHAKKMIKEDPDRMIKDIAVELGYSDPYYFSKVFHKQTGMWPSEYH